jgi:hypothetical protein
MPSDSRSIDITDPLEIEIDDIPEIKVSPFTGKLDLRNIKKVVVEPMEGIEGVVVTDINGDTV